MAGNYLEADRHHGLTSVFPAFRFIRWHLIDIFIYFSHHAVTLPPLSWINVAHRQGVRVYGTVLFESNPDEFVNHFFLDPSPSDPTVVTFATHLDRVRRELCFEGWLLNFEVELPTPVVQTRVATFIRTLKSLGSEVIWYDSVTWSGNLCYQNALTPENKPFLDLGVDGLYTNYAWSMEHLQRTQNLAEDALTSSRIFVGVDCFGRGCPGGGGWSTYEALKLILDAMLANPDRPLSIALFAPGWPFENCDLSSCSDDPFESLRRISSYDEQFWIPLEYHLDRIRALPYGCLEIHRPAVLSKGLISPEKDVVLRTTCCTGQGQIGARGAFASSMSLQELIPTCRQCSDGPVPAESSSSPYVQRGYTAFHVVCTTAKPGQSGTCIRICPLDGDFQTRCFIELFTFGPDLSLSARDASVRLILAALRQSVHTPSVPMVNAYKLFLDYYSEPRSSPDAAPIRRFLNHHHVEADCSGFHHWMTLDFRINDLPNLTADYFKLVRLGMVWDATVNPDGFLLRFIEIRNSSDHCL